MGHVGTTSATGHVDGVAAASPDYVELVRCATLAASSHNTQPWRFELRPNRVVILPDLSRRCPEVDPDNHHLFASLGCAAENLMLAAAAAGLRGHLCYRASESSVQVDFEAAAPTTSSLVHAIALRQCSRTEYDGTELTVEELGLLERAGRGDGVSIRILTGSRHKGQLAEYVAAGNAAQFRDPKWANEMRKWIRFNRREAVRTGDGLYGAVLGIPSVPRWLGKLLMPLAVSAERQSEKDLRHIRSSAAIAVLFSDADDEPHWVEAGRCYERLALQATALDLRTAFINQPVEVAALRPQLAGYLGIGHRRPDLVVRIGRGPTMPRSFRRPIEHVLVET
jgi:hypothetical protein